MPRLTIKLPRKLNRVEIIRGKDIKAADYFSFLPIDKMPAEDFVEELFDIEIAELRNSETEKEIFIAENIPIKHKFEHQLLFNEQLHPIKIDISKLPIDTVPLEEVKRQVQDSYEKGFKDGQEVTREFFADELIRHQEWVRKFDTLANKLRAGYSQELKKLEEMIIGLGLMASEHILKREISQHSDIILEQVQKAIAQTDNETIFRIFLNPKDIQILEEVRSTLLANKELKHKIELASDDSVEVGACIVDTSSGLIDGRLKTQLEVIQRKLDSLPQTAPIESVGQDFAFDTEV